MQLMLNIMQNESAAVAVLPWAILYHLEIFEMVFIMIIMKSQKVGRILKQ